MYENSDNSTKHQMEEKMSELQKIRIKLKAYDHAMLDQSAAKIVEIPGPRDSPGKNTGVGCHFLLQCMKVKSQSEVAQLCPTLSNPMDCSLRGSSIHGVFQARVLEWGAIAFACQPEINLFLVLRKISYFTCA